MNKCMGTDNPKKAAENFLILKFKWNIGILITIDINLSNHCIKIIKILFSSDWILDKNSECKYELFVYYKYYIFLGAINYVINLYITLKQLQK